jgi:hypothetical protein
MGAITSLWAGTAPETLDYNGQVRWSPTQSLHVLISVAVFDPMGEAGQRPHGGGRSGPQKAAVQLVGGAGCRSLIIGLF